MTLEKRQVIDQVTVAENGTVFYRIAERIFEEEKQLSETYIRHTLVPGQDIAGQPERVQAICQAAWTDEVLEAWAEKPSPTP
jgi:hypothetical protein